MAVSVAHLQITFAATQAVRPHNSPVAKDNEAILIATVISKSYSHTCERCLHGRVSDVSARVPRTTGRIAGRKRSFLTLHARLDRFKAKNGELGAALMAVKWLGNAASHSSSLTRDDVLDGFEILEHVLDEPYSQREARVRSLSSEINRRKAPRSRRRPSRPSF